MALITSLIVNLCLGSVDLSSISKEGLVVEKTENSAIFEYEDGRKETVMYGSNLRCKDTEGNLDEIIFNNNKDITALKYSYNTYKWLTMIEAVRSDGTLVPIREYTYDKNGKVQTYKDYTDILNSAGKYIQKQYTYNVLDRVSTMEYFKSTNLSSAVESYAYTYDKNNNITSEMLSYHYANNEYTE